MPRHVWGARPSRASAKASRFRELGPQQVRFGETGALPGTLRGRLVLRLSTAQSSRAGRLLFITKSQNIARWLLT